MSSPQYRIDYFAENCPAGTNYRIATFHNVDEALDFIKNWIGFNVEAILTLPDGSWHEFNSSQDYNNFVNRIAA
jgi:hypothetical protein